MLIPVAGYSRNVDSDWNGQAVVETSDHNIVVVTFNYRVGIFGFLAGEDVLRDGDLNVGLLDQRLLLGWVQKNIAKVSTSLLSPRATCCSFHDVNDIHACTHISTHIYTHV